MTDRSKWTKEEEKFIKNIVKETIFAMIIVSLALIFGLYLLITKVIL